MSDVTVQLVREFFELNAFHVMTYWQHDSERTRAEHGLQLFVENTAPAGTRPRDCVLKVGDVASLPRALVEVRAWHAERLYASVIESNRVLLEVAQETLMARARQVFGASDVPSILVISELAASPEARQSAVNLLQQGGITYVLEFPTILHEILGKINAYVSYSPSHTLQTLRLLKRYDLVRFQQLELPFPTEAPMSAAAPTVETQEESPGEDVD